MVPHQNGVFISYLRVLGNGNDFNIYGRSYMPGVGMGDETVICDAPGYQLRHSLTTGEVGLGLAWADEREGNFMYIQQFNHGQWRWPNGYRLAAIEMSPLPQLDACNGNRFGLVVYGDLGTYLHVQPLDSLTGDAVAPGYVAATQSFRLFDPYPNPFNGRVQIHFELKQGENIELAVYNLLGQQQIILAEGRLIAGVHSLQWENNLSSGVYLLCLRSKYGMQVKKLLAIK
jgi:hypothetical protein